jgi:hypothetical protein
MLLDRHRYQLVPSRRHSEPHIGSVGALEEVQEARVETVYLGEDVARKAVEALKM